MLKVGVISSAEGVFIEIRATGVLGYVPLATLFTLTRPQPPQRSLSTRFPLLTLPQQCDTSIVPCALMRRSYPVRNVVESVNFWGGLTEPDCLPQSLTTHFTYALAACA